MKRIHFQLHERTYEILRRQAIQKGCSLSSLIRELLVRSLGTGKARRRASINEFTFIGAGGSRQGQISPVSERHDEALAVRIPKRKEEWNLLRPKKQSWAALSESLDKFTDDFMKHGRNQAHIPKRGRISS